MVCALCFLQEENLSHLMFQCGSSKQIWQENYSWLKIDLVDYVCSKENFIFFSNQFKVKMENYSE